MKLELTEAEHELTLHILRNRLGELREEIHHSTVAKFTDQLKEKAIVLKAVISKLDAVESKQ